MTHRQLNLSIDSETLRLLKAICRKTERNQSSMVRFLVRSAAQALLEPARTSRLAAKSEAGK